MWFETGSGRHYSFPPADISQTAGENLRAVLHSLLAQRSWLPPAPPAGPERSRAKNDRHKRLPACPANLRVFVPDARNRTRTCRMRIVRVDW